MNNDLILPNEPKIVADSTNWLGIRLTSFVFPIPTCLLAELRTHRLLAWSEDYEYSIDKNISEFSVNANSDRAIPIKTKIQMVKDNPYYPIPSLANKGMTANENVSDGAKAVLKAQWKKALDYMLEISNDLLDLGASKQYVNRLLMPFSWSLVIVTGDNFAWDHFFKLRTAKDVEPNFREIAIILQNLYQKSVPEFKEVGQYHIAFQDECKNYESSYLEDLMISGSCSARLSYNIEREETLKKHKDRFILCVESGHSSITEHQARVPSKKEIDRLKMFGELRSNVDGWLLLRKLIESGNLKIKDGSLVEKGKWER